MATSDDSDLASVLTLLKEQIAASEAREQRLASMLETALSPKASTSTETPPPRVVPTDRPTLLASATLAEFQSWEDAWQDYSRCQQLQRQDQPTRVSVLRQCLDNDLKRFIRQEVIAVQDDDDVDDIIQKIQHYVRAQRHPLLDRVEFYKRQQDSGESFDSFFTSLRELHKMCDLKDSFLCLTCQSQLCSDCTHEIRSSEDQMHRPKRPATQMGKNGDRPEYTIAYLPYIAMHFYRPRMAIQSQ